MRDLIILLVHLIATLARSAVCRGRIALGQASTADSQSLAATGAEPPSVGSDPRRCLYAVHAPCLEFLDRGLQLGDGGADIWQLDDISGRCLGELAQPGQFVGDPLFVVQRVGKIREDATGEGNVTGLELDPGTLGARLLRSVATNRSPRPALRRSSPR